MNDTPFTIGRFDKISGGFDADSIKKALTTTDSPLWKTFLRAQNQPRM